MIYCIVKAIVRFLFDPPCAILSLGAANLIRHREVFSIWKLKN